MARPAFQATVEQRAQVAEWHSARVSGAEIARRLGTTKPTLWKHFRNELGAQPASEVRKQAKLERAEQPSKARAPVEELPLWNACAGINSTVANAVRERPQLESKGMDCQTAVASQTPAPLESSPAFRSTSRQRQAVEVLAAARIPTEEIAAYLDLEIEVVKEHFATELALGGARRNSEIILSIYTAATAGNTSSQRLWLALATVLPPSGGDTEEKKQPVTAQVGKKVAELNAAKTAGQGTEWGDDLTPPGLRLVKS